MTFHHEEMIVSFLWSTDRIWCSAIVLDCMHFVFSLNTLITETLAQTFVCIKDSSLISSFRWTMIDLQYKIVISRHGAKFRLLLGCRWTETPYAKMNSVVAVMLRSGKVWLVNWSLCIQHRVHIILCDNSEVWCHLGLNGSCNIHFHSRFDLWKKLVDISVVLQEERHQNYCLIDN